MQPYQNRTSAWGQTVTRSQAEVDQGLRAFMLGVYNNMVIGLAISALVALGVNMLAVADSPAETVARLAGVNLTSFGRTLYTTPLMWVFALAPLAFIFFFSFRMERMSAATARITFFAFAAAMGVSLSTLLIRYTGASVVQVFFITAASFGALSLYGYTTQRSLSGIGSFLVMGLIGLMLASIVNIFVASSMLQFAISVIGRADLRGPHGLRHAEAEGDVRLRQLRQRGRREGLDLRRPDALPRLHQHVPVPAGARGQPQRVSRNQDLVRDEAPAKAGLFRCASVRCPASAAWALPSSVAMTAGAALPRAMSLLIRPSRDFDLTAVTAIYRPAVLHGTASFELEPPDEAEMARRRRALLEGGYPYLVAERDGAVVGYAYAGAYRTRPAYRSTVEDSVYVAPAAQGDRGRADAARGARRGMREPRLPAHGGGDRRRGLAGLHRPARGARLPARRRHRGRRPQARPLARHRADAARPGPGDERAADHLAFPVNGEGAGGSSPSPRATGRGSG
jgi:FtsH-binding integral membrane protein